MSTNIFRALILIFLPSIVWGQSIDISATQKTADNNPSTFLLEEQEVIINSDEFQFISSGNSVVEFESLGISPDHSVISFLKRTSDGGQLTLFNSAGDTLNQYSTISLASNDPSQAVYSFNNGHTLIRNNITNFTFYDTFGEISTSMSSSSQSKEGEAISEVTISEDGGTVVIYNPKIKRSGNIGSQAQVKLPEERFERIFSSSDRYIKDVKVSDDGSIIGIITSGQGSADEVLILDKFGNELNRISSSEVLQGVTFSENTANITLYSQGRVRVYPTLGNDSIGSTSIQNTVFQANYFPEDNLIVAISGSFSESTGILNNVEVRAIDLEQRQITSESYGNAVGFHQAIEPRLSRISAGTYRLEGASQQLLISANF